MFRRKSAVFKAALVILALMAFCPIPAQATGVTHGVAPSYIAVPYGTEQCVASNVSICGLTVPVPNAALGASITASVPSPYVHQPFTVQCTPAGYEIIDSSSVTCAIQTCPPTSVPLCGTAIPVPGGTRIGGTVQVPVPAADLADPAFAAPDLALTAQCVDDGNGGAVYQAGGNGNISCNLFPCPDARIRLCETSIAIEGGAPLGGVLHLAMPPPFTPDPFTVQCVGSGGNPPMYQMTDGSAITCDTLPPGQ